MRAVLQRVLRAAVSVDGEVVGAIGREGLFVLLGVTHSDTAAEAGVIARKIADLRILDGERSASEVAAPILVVSQFTLYGETKKGRRPTWSKAAPGEVAEALVAAVVDQLRARGLEVATGRFGAMMDIDMVASGPVTLVLEA